MVGAASGMIQDTLLWGTTALGGVAVQVAGHQESVLDMVLGSGPVVRAVLIILLGFSVGCWGIALAKSIDKSQDFSGMPILADALQDAGCDGEELLNHLRDTSATHVRGCWALDLILGKE